MNLIDHTTLSVYPSLRCLGGIHKAMATVSTLSESVFARTGHTQIFDGGIVRMKKRFITLLFWGSLWGFTEATLGYILHQAAVFLPGLPGFLMFPLAFYFMYQVYQKTGQSSSGILVALVAAIIKLFDFFVPGNDIIRILNPALSILLEGLAVSLVLSAFARRGQLMKWMYAFGAGIGWRALFLIHLYLISKFGLPAALVTDGLSTSLRFLLFESFINSLLIYFGWRWLALIPKLAGSHRLNDQHRPVGVEMTNAEGTLISVTQTLSASGLFLLAIASTLLL